LRRPGRPAFEAHYPQLVPRLLVEAHARDPRSRSERRTAIPRSTGVLKPDSRRSSEDAE
jgi:hypothetical protein